MNGKCYNAPCTPSHGRIFSPVNLKGDCFLSNKKFEVTRRGLKLRALAIVLLVMTISAILPMPVFAKTTYVITDGHQVTVHKTYESDVSKVLTDAGVELEHTDKYVTRPSWNRHDITIQRAKNVVVDLLGQRMELVFHGNTVGELMAFAGVKLPEGARLSAPADSLVTDGMELQITRTITVREYFTMEIPFRTEYVETNYLKKGETVVLSEGKAGLAACYGKVEYVDGIPQNRNPENYDIRMAPVNRLIAVGTGTGKAKQGAPIVGQNKLLTWKGEVLEFTHSEEFKATAYYRFPVDGEITAMGTPTRVGAIAVDPTVIPYWTKMYIVTQDGEYIYGVAVAEDCGTAIKGKWVDLFFETYKEACDFGRRQVDIYFLA